MSDNFGGTTTGPRKAALVKIPNFRYLAKYQNIEIMPATAP
jgi:hypothetical protein